MTPARGIAIFLCSNERCGNTCVARVTRPYDHEHEPSSPCYCHDNGEKTSYEFIGWVVE